MRPRDEMKPHAVLLLAALGLLLVFVAAKELSSVVFPVAELGNCSSEAECKAFCDEEANFKACVGFAEKAGLLSGEELRAAKKFIEVGVGPGGCTTPRSCEKYCDNTWHMEECVAFAEENNLRPAEELADAKKVVAAIKAGAKVPGNCRNKQECDAYCGEPAHMAECFEFAKAAGFVTPEEVRDGEKMLEAIKKGFEPPKCRGKEECDVYCRTPEHFEECINFAEAAGLISGVELEDARRALVAVNKGVQPPQCKGKVECDVYCSQPEHFEECISFAEAAGFISGEEARMIRKTGGSGPGGCKSKEECDAYCKKPENSEVCFEFAYRHGLLSEEELRQIEEARAKISQALAEAPAEFAACLTRKLGQEKVEKMRAGTIMPTPELKEAMDACREEMPKPEERRPPEGMPPSGEMPPGEAPPQPPEGMPPQEGAPPQPPA